MKETEDDTKQATRDESRIQIDTSHTQLEISNSNNTEKQDNAKLVRSEIVVKIDGSFHDKSKRDGQNKDIAVYECHGQKRPLPTTWVFFVHQGGMAIPSDGGPPLDYTPDRNSFVRLVFTILFIMIASTAFLNSLVYIVEDLKDVFLENGMYISIFSMILMIGLNYAMACSACTRIVPCNIICLVLAVIGMSLLCCVITVRYDTTIVLLAVAATAGVVLLCIALACTNFDFTSWLLYVIMIAGAFGLVAMIASLYMLISGNYIKLLHLVILCVGTVINVVILIIELQMVLGGKTVELSEDDYALGAFLLYTSIIDIFLKLVQIFGIIEDW